MLQRALGAGLCTGAADTAGLCTNSIATDSMRMQEWAERNNYTTVPLYVDLAVRFIHETAFAISTRRGCACCASAFLLCVCLFPSPAQLISAAELPCLRHSCMIMCA